MNSIDRGKQIYLFIASRPLLPVISLAFAISAGTSGLKAVK